MDKKTFQNIIHEISYKPTLRMHLFRGLSLEDQYQVLRKTTKHIKTDILKQLTDTEISQVLEEFDTVEATDLIQLLPAERRTKVIESLNEFLRRDLSILLSFNPSTAAGLMNLDYVQVWVDDTFHQVAEKVQTHEQRTGKTPTILVFEEDNLLGFLPGYKLALAGVDELVKNHIKKIASINHDVHQDEVLDFFRNHPHSKVVVLGERNNVLGVIYSDDILKLLQEQESSSLYDFAGVRADESIYDSIKNKFYFRYKWLIINLGTAFLAAFTVGLFKDIIEKEVLLAVYMPIVAGMGGNAGTQTLAVMVRGLAQRDLYWKDILQVLRNEVGAGFLNGLVNGLLVFLIVFIFNQSILVASVLAIAMVVNLLIAAFFGTLIPVWMHRLGKDPASSATIFITTATDILGFFVFLGLAAFLL